jgi:hypothetical protein
MYISAYILCQFITQQIVTFFPITSSKK